MSNTSVENYSTNNENAAFEGFLILKINIILFVPLISVRRTQFKYVRYSPEDQTRLIAPDF